MGAEALLAVASAIENDACEFRLDLCPNLLLRAIDEFERFKTSVEQGRWDFRSNRRSSDEERRTMFKLKLDDSLLTDYVAESREQLETVEADLLAIEEEGAEINEERVNRVFRTVHTIKGASGFFDLTKIGELAHQTENVLALVRSRKMVPTPGSIGVVLRATDRLNEMSAECDYEQPGRRI